MPAYRFDIASTSRAKCKSAECKTTQAKIQKGDLRFGSLISTERFESWSYKHWGCVTPTQIENVVKAIGGLEAFDEDPNVLDGYDEVDEASREKIRTALKEGHVPDEDWKGDPENNRPGARGMKAKRTPKKTKQGDAEEGDEEGKEGTPSPSKSKAKKSKKAKNAESKDEDRDVSPAPKKTASRKRKTGAEDEGPASEMPAKKARGRKAKPQRHDAEEESEPEVMPAKKQRGKKLQQTGGADDDATPEVKPAKKSVTKKATEEEENGNHKNSTTRAKEADGKPRAKKAAAEEGEHPTEGEPVKTKRSRPRSKKALKATNSDTLPADTYPADGVDTAEEEAEHPTEAEPVKTKRPGPRTKKALKAANSDTLAADTYTADGGAGADPGGIGHIETDGEAEVDAGKLSKQQPGRRGGGRRKAATGES